MKAGIFKAEFRSVFIQYGLHRWNGSHRDKDIHKNKTTDYACDLQATQSTDTNSAKNVNRVQKSFCNGRQRP